MSKISITLKLEDFPTFISYLRSNSPDYEALIKSSGQFSVLNGCFSKMQEACCSRKKQINASCSVGFSSFVMNQQELSRPFFLLVKEQMSLERIAFSEGDIELLFY